MKDRSPRRDRPVGARSTIDRRLYGAPRKFRLWPGAVLCAEWARERAASGILLRERPHNRV